MMRFLCMFLVCGSLSGCHPASPFHFFPIAEAHLHPLPPEAEMSVSASDLTDIPLGTRVEIVNQKIPETTHTYIGTLIHTSPNGAVLSNCEVHGRTVHTPKGLLAIPPFSRLFKNSGVGVNKIPVQWVSISKMSSMKVLEQPAPTFVAPNLVIDTDDRVYYERIGIDFGDNQQLRNGQPQLVSTRILPDGTRVEEVLNSSTSGP